MLQKNLFKEIPILLKKIWLIEKINKIHKFFFFHFSFAHEIYKLLVMTAAFNNFSIFISVTLHEIVQETK